MLKIAAALVCGTMSLPPNVDHVVLSPHTFAQLCGQAEICAFPMPTDRDPAHWTVATRHGDTHTDAEIACYFERDASTAADWAE